MAEIKDRLSLLAVNTDQPDWGMTARLNDSLASLHEFMLSIPDPAPRLPAKRTALVVGGGIVGLLTAFYMHLEGFQVTLLERKSYGAAASGRNGGGILALGRDLQEIPMIRISIDLWEQLRSFGVETGFSRTGHAMVAMTDFESRKLQQAHDLYRQAGLPAEWLEPAEAVRKLPDLNPRNHGALYSPIDAQGYPFHAVNGLVSRLKSSGAQVINHCEVTGFRTNGDQVSGVHTNVGDFEADDVILCAGPWTSELGVKLDVHLPIAARRSQIMVTEIVRNRRVDPFVSGNNLYLRQSHAGNLLYGGGGPWEKNGFDVANSVEAIRKLSTYFTEMFPGYRSLHLIRSFAGTVEITQDHRPLLGDVQPYRNLYVSSGYSGHGYGMSAFGAKLLAKHLACQAGGQPMPQPLEELVASFTPDRFNRDSGS